MRLNPLAALRCEQTCWAKEEDEDDDPEDDGVAEAGGDVTAS
jgi:hypothetical protein